jgi:glutaconate CoA-transferase subunit B|tara:strand:- start:10272 stop:11015 length:744 start_codon:yes stop_codon:yes gene_type:complete
LSSGFDLGPEERLAILLSRHVHDWETSACGALSFIPATAMLLARELHAPNVEIIILGSKEYSPFVSGKDFHFLAQRGEMDLFFISAIEIDKHGNFNLHVIGDRDEPDVLMPGQYGTGLLYYAVPRIVMFRTEHTTRTFVEQVDYISGAGTSPEGVRRRTREVTVVTPIAQLRFNMETRLMELASVHEGFTADQVAENTGFDLGIDGPVETTPVITEAEVQALRTIVKPHMIESETYPDLAARLIREP